MTISKILIQFNVFFLGMLWDTVLLFDSSGERY